MLNQYIDKTCARKIRPLPTNQPRGTFSVINVHFDQRRKRGSVCEEKLINRANCMWQLNYTHCETVSELQRLSKRTRTDLAKYLQCLGYCVI